MGSIRTTFFTSANRPYEFFVLPYVTAALVHNDDARVEVCLEDSSRFRQANEEALAVLEDGFGKSRFHFRDSERTAQIPAKVSPNSVRFIEVPEVMTTFTYIGDIDILCLESVADRHLKRMEQTGRPYCNVLRPGRQALSGLHFTRSDAFYPQHLPDDADFRRDEYLLYEIAVAKGLDLPAADELWRPIHGYHLSLNRAPLDKVGWSVTDRRYFNAYKELRKHPVWRGVLPHFDSKYALLLGLVDLAAEQVAREHALEFAPEYARRLVEDRRLVQAIARDSG